MSPECRALVCGWTIWLSVTACARPGAPGAAPAQSPPTAPSALFEALNGLEIAFTDPATQRIYRATGPFSVVSSDAESLWIEGLDERFRTAPMRLFLRDGGLWVLARIDGREFLARLE